MNKYLSKVLCVLLSLLIISSIIPMTASANDNSKNFSSEDNTEVTVSGISGMDLILNNLEQTNIDENNSGCSVFSVSVSNKTATVKCSTIVDCKLVVAIYDDHTEQMLGSGMTDINKETVEVDVNIDIDAMPKYYLIKAFMLDNNLAPLSSSFSFFEHTSIYEQFMSVSPDDFDNERVIPFGENVEQSFGALSDDVEIADYNQQMVIDYDSETGVYTFINATSDIKSLKIGDTLFYQKAEDDFILLKVATISIKDNVVTISEDSDISLEDAFDYIRYDEGAYYDNITSDDISTGDAIEVVGDIEISDAEDYNFYENSRNIEISTQSNEDYGDEGSTLKGQLISTTFSIDYPNKNTKKEQEKKWLEKGIKVTGSLGYTLSASARLHWDIKIGPDYFEYKVEVESKVEFDIKVTGSLSLNKDSVCWQLDGKDKNGNPKGIKLGKTGLFRLYIKAYPIASVTGEIDLLKITLTSIKGSSINSNDGFNKISGDYKWIDTPDLLNIKVTIKIGIGIEFEVGRKVGKKDDNGDQKIIASVAISVEAFLQAELTPDELDPHKHPCKFCLKADIDFCVEGNLTIRLKLFKILKNIKNEKVKKYIKNNGKLEITALSLGWSKDLGEGYCGHNGKKLQIGWGTCPNKKTMVTVWVKDPQTKMPIENVEIITDDTCFKTNSEGKVELYFTPGTYTIKAVYNNVEKTNTVSVSEFEKEILFTFSADDKPDDNVSGNVVSSYSSGTLTISGTGNMDNFSGIDQAPWNSYKESIKKIVVESGVTGIGNYAFAKCTNLQTVTIADTVKTIGSAAFYECNSLKELKLPQSLKTIGDYAFYNNYSMTSIDLASVESIGSYAFAQCDGLTSVVVPASTTSIGEAAFAWCDNLTSIYIYNKNCNINLSPNTIYVDAKIYGAIGSSAQTYAKNFGRSFGVISVKSNSNDLVLNGTNDAIVVNAAVSSADTYKINQASCVPGGSYILINVTGWGNNFVLTSDNLFYIDQVVADENGVVKTDFIPKEYKSNSTTLLIGKFGNGTVQKIVTIKKYVDMSGCEIAIQNPSTKTVNYGDTLVLQANISLDELEEGTTFVWTVDGAGFNMVPTDDGLTCYMTSIENGDATVKVTLVDENGDAVLDAEGNEIFAEITLKSNASFWQKIVSFFKNLFRINRKIY